MSGPGQKITSDDRYRALLESLDALIVRVDLQNRFTYVNPLYCETFGKSKEELIGHSFIPLVHERDCESTKAAMEDLFRPPHKCQLEQRAKTVRGWRWLHWDDHAILDEQGNIIEIQGVGRDITERKERERELLWQQRRLSLAQQFAGAGMWEYTFADQKLYWSPECKAVLGVEDEDCNGTYEDFLHCVHPDDRELVIGINEPIVEKGMRIPLDYRHRILKPDGSVRWIREVAGLVTDSDGESVGLVGFAMDCTHQREKEAALEQAGMIQQIMENIEGVFLLISADRMSVLYANKRFEIILGKHVDVLYENPTVYFDSVVEDDRQAALEAYHQFLESGFLDHEMRIRNAANELRWIHLRLFPVENDMNEVVRHVGFAHDVTQRKEHENAILEAKIVAEDSLRSKNAFLAAINHELRTPISHVLNFSELVQELSREPEIAEFAKGIQRSARHLLDMFEDIMTLSDSSGTGVKIRAEEFLLSELNSLVMDQLRSIAETQEKSPSLRLENDIDPIMAGKAVCADRSKVLQVLANFMRNAVKFTEAGWVKFVISKDEKRRLHLSVEDTGIGIPDGETNRIFDLFHQADRKKNRGYEGLGIGLAISKRIADAMDARIEVKSSEGEGSRFTLILPADVWRDATFEND